MRRCGAVASFRHCVAATPLRRYSVSTPLQRRAPVAPLHHGPPQLRHPISFRLECATPPRCSVGIPPQNFGLDRVKWLGNDETSALEALCRQNGNTRPGKILSVVIQWHLFSPVFAISDRSFVIFKPFRAQFEGLFPRVRCFVIFKPLGGSCVPHDR